MYATEYVMVTPSANFRCCCSKSCCVVAPDISTKLLLRAVVEATTPTIIILPGLIPGMVEATALINAFEFLGSAKKASTEMPARACEPKKDTLVDTPLPCLVGAPVEGTAVGLAVGLPDGCELGSPVGTKMGCALGCPVGVQLGWTVGLLEGCLLGWPVGRPTGCLVG